MRKVTGLLLISMLISTSSAFAGDLMFEGDDAVWRSLKCVRPLPPLSLSESHSETRGNAMNAKVVAINSFVDATQEYMDCIKQEAEADSQAFADAVLAGADAIIAQAQAEAERLSSSMRAQKK